MVEADTGDSRYRGLAEREIIHVPRRHAGVVLAGVVWIAAGIAAMSLLHALPRVLLWARSQTWQAVPCQVVSASLKPTKGVESAASDFEPRLEYEYQFGGTTHKGTRWRPGQPAFWASYSNAPRTSSEAALSRLKDAKTCYVDPRDPTESVLERTFPPIAAIEVLALTLLCVVPGITGVVWGVKES